MGEKFTHERVYERDINEWNYLHEYLVFLRHKASYQFVSKLSKPDYCLLDYGTGAGYGSKLMVGRYKTYYGVDVSASAIKHATKQYGSKNVNFIKLNKNGKLPFSNNQFDLVVSFQVIEHVEDVHFYLTEIFRVLKANGRALMTTPNRLLRSYKYQRPINKYHLREYSPTELLKQVKTLFNEVEPYGVFGSEKITEIEVDRLRYYRSVSNYFKQITKLLIKALLKIVGLNEFVRKKIKKNYEDNICSNKELLSIDRRGWDTFKVEDYRLSSESINNSLDLFYILTKRGD